LSSFLLFPNIALGRKLTYFSGCIIVNLILSRFEGNCVLYSKLVKDSYSQPANPSFLISEFGKRSNCGFIIVVSEIILISAPFLLILLAVIFTPEPLRLFALGQLAGGAFLRLENSCPEAVQTQKSPSGQLPEGRRPEGLRSEKKIVLKFFY
jgi:hypothetical protein